MGYDGPDRRVAPRSYNGPDRRAVRALDDAELRDAVHDLATRVERLEENADRLSKVPDAVAELKGAVQTLSSLVVTRFDGLQPSVEKAASLKTAVQFAAIVLVPILVALIGGYVALKAGSGGPTK